MKQMIIILIAAMLMIGLVQPYSYDGRIEIYKPGGYCGDLTDYIQPGINQIIWLNWEITPPDNRIGPAYHLEGNLYNDYGNECQVLEVFQFWPLNKPSTGIKR